MMLKLSATSFASLLLLMTFLQYGLSLPLTSSSEVHVQLIKEHTHARARRAVADSNLPDELTFSLHGRGMELRLKRSPRLPMATSEGMLNDRFLQDAGVYTDAATGSAMIVKRESGDYHLSGMFNQDGQPFELRPLSRLERSAGKPNHVIAPANDDDDSLQFGDDGIDSGDYIMPQIIDLFPEIQKVGGARVRRAATNDQHEAEGSRKKRSTVLHTIETAMIVQNALYTDSRWVDRPGSSGNVMQEIELWYTYIAEAIRIRFENIADADIAMTVKITKLYIQTDPAEDFVEDLEGAFFAGLFDGSEALDILAEYVENKTAATLIPVSDHYMLFTKYKPTIGVGIANVGEVCTFDGVSITQDNHRGNTAAIAAHELGHSLGSDHDNDTSGECTDNDQFIMATGLSVPVEAENIGNPWRFSACSITAFKAYLATVTCTTPENTSSEPDALPPPASGSEGGQVIDRDNQCELRFPGLSPASTFCDDVYPGGAIDALCGGMYCDSNEASPSGGTYCYPVIPLEFTSCGENKWCVEGACVDIPSTSSTITTTEASTTTSTTDESTTSTTDESTTSTTDESTSSTTDTSTTSTTEESTTSTTDTSTTSTSDDSTPSTTEESTTSTTEESTTSTSDASTTSTTDTSTTSTTEESTTSTSDASTTSTTDADTTTTTTAATPPMNPRRLLIVRTCQFFQRFGLTRAYNRCLRALARFDRREARRQQRQQRRRNNSSNNSSGE